MSNNKSIQILRGSASNVSIAKASLLDGQPLLDKTNNYLYVGNGSNSSLQPITTNRVVYDDNHKINVTSSGITITGATNIDGATTINGENVVLAGGGAETANQGKIKLSSEGPQVSIQGTDIKIADENNYNKIVLSSSESSESNGTYLNSTEYIALYAGANTSSGDKAGVSLDPTNGVSVVADNGITLTTNTDDSDVSISLNAVTDAPGRYKSKISLNPFNGISVVADNGISVVAYYNSSLEVEGDIQLDADNIYLGADIIPENNASYNLGSDQKRFSTLYTYYLDAQNITGTGMIGDDSDDPPLQGYNRSNGTVEERLTNLGFKQGSLKDSSNNTIATLTRIGYYVLVNCVRAGTSSSFSGIDGATLDDFKPQSNRTNTISLPVYYGSDSARVIIACNMSANGILFISGSISGLGGWSEGTMSISATFGYDIRG